jgi:LysM repeat protein
MRWILACVVILGSLTACGPSTVPSTPMVSAPQPYSTVAHSPSPTLLPPLTQDILPTPTIFLYVVVQGDTLTGIAKRFGVALEALISANPGVQPAALSVGTKLTIPVGAAVAGEATPTPVPLNVRQARCWPGTQGGLWCFALVQNDYAETLENLSAQFSLVGQTGQVLTSQVAFASLDILPSGQSMPIAAYFPPPAPATPAERVQVLTAIRLVPGDARYLPAVVRDSVVSVDWSGRSAQVGGRVELTSATGKANSVWVLAVAYDNAGEVVGMRRWELPSPLDGGHSAEFSFPVSSVGPGIERVEFLVEARP